MDHSNGANFSAAGSRHKGRNCTPFGVSLSLTGADVNGNFSHAVFTSIGPFQIVDQDASGQVVSIALAESIPKPPREVMVHSAKRAITVTRDSQGDKQIHPQGEELQDAQREARNA
jgi:hypothetical protein